METGRLLWKRITINGLFGKFDYDIPLNTREGVTIIHGINGTGKTTLLKILQAIAEGNFGDVFWKFRFKTIRLIFESEGNPETTLFIDHDDLIMTLKQGDLAEQKHQFDVALYLAQLKLIQRVDLYANYYFNKIMQYHPDGSFELKGDEKTTNEVMRKLYPWLIDEETLPWKTPDQVPWDDIQEHPSKARIENIQDLERELNHILKDPDWFGSFLPRIPVHLIPANRMTYTTAPEESIEFFVGEHGDRASLNVNSLGAAIEVARKLGSEAEEKIVNGIEAILNFVNQFLDGKRIVFNAKYGLKRDARFLLDKCLKVEDLGTKQRYELFELSSGEKGIFNLFFEIILRTLPGSLILIDEPEISLHVTWQIDIVKCLLAIHARAGIDFLVATHSPQIVHDRRDLCVRLESPE